MNAPIRMLVGCFALIALAGCASSTIRSHHAYSGDRFTRPQYVIIHDFGATSDDVPADSGLTGRASAHTSPQTSEQVALGRKLGSEVAQELVDEINAMGLPAARRRSLETS